MKALKSSHLQKAKCTGEYMRLQLGNKIIELHFFMGQDQTFRFHLYWFKRVVVKMCNDNKRHVNMVWGGRPSRPQPDTKKTTDA